VSVMNTLNYRLGTPREWLKAQVKKSEWLLNGGELQGFKDEKYQLL